ncbi:MAG: hypothetical protein K6E50_11970 [Lachnospiraceae bacterium]|nr:hypothetical protein [Lachnospiraceae bacterium]
MNFLNPESKVGQDIWSTITGNLPKAIILVPKFTEGGTTLSQAEQNEILENARKEHEEKGGETGSVADLTKKGMMSKFEKTSTDTMNKAAGLLRNKNSEHSGSMRMGDIKSQATDYVALTVQYNPASISIDTTAGVREMESKNVSNVVQNQRTVIETNCITSLRTQLVFDKMNVLDAFMLDSSMLSTGTIPNVVDNIFAKHSVRTIAEGLMACLLSPLTRKVIFVWSKMIFAGNLNQVMINYTMFNKAGNPVRCTVDLEIQQNHEMDKNEDGSYWAKAFEKTFGQAGVSNVVGAGVTDKLKHVGNNAILNIGI